MSQSDDEDQESNRTIGGNQMKLPLSLSREPCIKFQEKRKKKKMNGPPSLHF